MFENRRWLVIPTTITGSIDFNEVLQSSVDSLRVSLDGTKTFVKYEINEISSSYEEYYQDAEDMDTWYTSSIQEGIYGRPSIYDEQYPEYNHSEILSLLNTDEWTNNEEIE